MNPNPITRFWVELNKYFVSREEASLALVTGLVAHEPVILIGPPETAKTALIEELIHNVENAKVFEKILTNRTHPMELFWVVDTGLLNEKGKLVKRTDKLLPSADLIFLDRIFDASPSIKSILLYVLNNRSIPDGTSVIETNWLGFFTEVNKVRYRSSEDELLYDSLTIRSFTNHVSDSIIVDSITKAIYLHDKGISLPKLTIADVKAAHAEAKKRFYGLLRDDTALRILKKVFYILENKGIKINEK